MPMRGCPCYNQFRLGPAMALTARGNIYAHQDEPEQAITDYSAVLAQDPTQVDLYYNRAVAFQEMGRFKLAEADYRAVLARQPDDVRSGYNLACLLAQQQKTQAAVTLLHSVLVHQPALTGHLRHDPDFDPIRSDPAFQTLIGDSDSLSA